MSGWRKATWRLGLVLLMGLAGCAPEYNWRQVAVADGRVTALMPAKPVVEQRDLPLGEQVLAFSLTQARVGDDWFVVGYAPWPSSFGADAELRTQLGQQVLISLYRNLGLEAPEVLPTIEEAFELSSPQADGVLITGRIWLTRHGLIEGLVMATKGQMPAAESVQFLDALGKSVAGQMP